MDNPYLLKVLLCESIDRLKALSHLIDDLPTLPDNAILTLLKKAEYMTKAVRDADKEWKSHSLKCDIAHGLIRKEAVKRSLVASHDDSDS